MDGGFYGSSNRMQQRHVSIYEHKKSILWAQSAKSDSLSKGTTQDALSVFIVSDMFKHVKESLIK